MNKEYMQMGIPKFEQCMECIHNEVARDSEEGLLGKFESTGLTTDDFDFISVIGRGTFGKVF